MVLGARAQYHIHLWMDGEKISQPTHLVSNGGVSFLCGRVKWGENWKAKSESETEKWKVYFRRESKLPKKTSKEV